jgi:hypothetical protein
MADIQDITWYQQALAEAYDVIKALQDHVLATQEERPIEVPPVLEILWGPESAHMGRPPLNWGTDLSGPDGTWARMRVATLAEIKETKPGGLWLLTKHPDPDGPLSIVLYEKVLNKMARYKDGVIV